jgi:hypothetical protein
VEQAIRDFFKNEIKHGMKTNSRKELQEEHFVLLEEERFRTDIQ